MSDASTQAAKNRRILVIDDNPAIHDDFRKVLRANGASNADLDAARAELLGESVPTVREESFELAFALQGQAGLELVREASAAGRPYAMAFIDMRMPPGWDGLATTAHLWRECPDLQVVICSAYSDYSWERIVRELGYSDQLLVLSKPFDNIEVRQLAYAQTEKWHLMRQASLKMDDLARMVNERTRDLQLARNELLMTNEQLSVAKQAAEEANQSKSEFLANISHEIRTPMTAILGYAELLRDEDAESLPAQERADAFDTILRNGNHLLEVINDILDLSKIEAGKLEVELVPSSPGRILSEVITLLHEKAEQKGLYLNSEFTGEIPETIQTDPMRLRQILFNLLGNAVKFTQRGGVRLQTGVVDDPAAGPQLQFDVADTGVGLTEQQIGKLFRPFVQADASATRRYGGTGLGLAICRRLARALGGDVVVVDTTPGKGSTFRLTLPIAALEDVRQVTPILDVTPAVAEEPQFVPNSYRILLAEDGFDNQRLISTILRKTGADVTIAENGRIALETVAEAENRGEPFDLVLMDMQMPELDGYEATRKLRAQGYRAPIIALTAHAIAGDREKCLQAGCDRYVPKPIVREDLFNAIGLCLKNEHAAGVEPSS